MCRFWWFDLGFFSGSISLRAAERSFFVLLSCLFCKDHFQRFSAQVSSPCGDSQNAAVARETDWTDSHAGMIGFSFKSCASLPAKTLSHRCTNT